MFDKLISNNQWLNTLLTSFLLSLFTDKDSMSNIDVLQTYNYIMPFILLLQNMLNFEDCGNIHF